ncbi:MAG: leishmanolysin-related zinc metalloendopeptidase [Candidatus Tectomicrobia bacterium]
MRHSFANFSDRIIDPGAPNTVRSDIVVRDVDGVIRDINVLIDIRHTFDQDLVISLIGPRRNRVLLVGREGGARNNFRLTIFDDEARQDIEGAGAPFRGVFRPESSLADFDGADPNGTWTLEIADRAFADGGRLRFWALQMDVADPQPSSQFNIEVNFTGGLTTRQRRAFSLAAARWSELIVGDLPDIPVQGQRIDDVRIDASGEVIDGAGRILGQAGPTRVRTDGGLPITGVMSFDVADLETLERNGSLVNVVIHEMGHVLGIGTLWQRMGLLQGAGTANPIFVGANAMREYGALLRVNRPMPVPVANTGGAGTRDGHWRESIFGNELMTGFLDGGINPVSRVTVAALEDMGYQVNYAAADDYQLPTNLELEIMGIREGDTRCDQCSALQGFGLQG